MEMHKNVDIEALNEQYRKAGVSEAVIKFATSHRDLLEKLSDNNFNNESTDTSSKE